MKRWYQTLALVVIAAVTAGAPLASPPAAGGDGSIVRGGRLYDTWYRELQVPPPRTPHPLLADKVGPGRAAAASWRCATCHGWDYRGTDGMPGIGRFRGAQPDAIAAILVDKTHGYGDELSGGDLLDLARFVSLGQVDMDAFVQRATGRPKGQGESHRDSYATICAGCHGQDGKEVRDVPPLGEIARERPYEALHVVLNGHPSGNMPALRALGMDAATGMLAFLQTLPAQNLAASIVRGGRLYDNWQAELNALPPSVPHPAYPATAVYADAAPRTWRCKECHGWDYLGRDGSYAKGPHATGIKGIRALAGASPAVIVEILRDDTHRYGAVLKQRDLLDVARFVSLGQIDMDAVIERGSRRVLGKAARAADHYDTICASCHGRDGRGMLSTVPLGRLANESPWEALHKIFNGHPGEPMPSLRVLGSEPLVDILAYVQTLPSDR